MRLPVKATAERHMPKCILEGCIRIALLANLEQIWCCVEAKEEAMGPEAHPTAFIEAARMHLAMLPLMTSKGAG